MRLLDWSRIEQTGTLLFGWALSQSPSSEEIAHDMIPGFLYGGPRLLVERHDVLAVSNRRLIYPANYGGWIHRNAICLDP